MAPYISLFTLSVFGGIVLILVDINRKAKPNVNKIISGNHQNNFTFFFFNLYLLINLLCTKYL